MLTKPKSTPESPKIANDPLSIAVLESENFMGERETIVTCIETCEDKSALRLLKQLTEYEVKLQQGVDYAKNEISQERVIPDVELKIQQVEESLSEVVRLRNDLEGTLQVLLSGKPDKVDPLSYDLTL